MLSNTCGRYPNDFFIILGRLHASAAVALLQQGGLLLPPHKLLKRACRGPGRQSAQATNAVWPECYLIFALEAAYVPPTPKISTACSYHFDMSTRYGAHNIHPFPSHIIGDAWYWIKP